MMCVYCQRSHTPTTEEIEKLREEVISGRDRMEKELKVLASEVSKMRAELDETHQELIRRVCMWSQLIVVHGISSLGSSAAVPPENQHRTETVQG